MSTTSGDSAILRGMVLMMRKMGIPKHEIMKTLQYQGGFKAINLFKGDHVDDWNNSNNGAAGNQQNPGNAPAEDEPVEAAAAGAGAGAGGMGGGRRRRAKTRKGKARRRVSRSRK